MSAPKTLIDRYKIWMPDGWYGWLKGEPNQVEQPLRALNPTDIQQQISFSNAVGELEGRLQSLSSAVGAALWVPSETSGIAGYVIIEMFRSERGTPVTVAIIERNALQAPVKQGGYLVEDREVEVSNWLADDFHEVFPAGQFATMIFINEDYKNEQTNQRFATRATVLVIDGCLDFVQFIGVTDNLDLCDQLAESTALMAKFIAIHTKSLFAANLKGMKST